MKICVYGASSDLIDKSYMDTVEKLGEKIALRGHSLVFGGGAHGLMGASARGVKKGGGKILGISPNFFDVSGVLYKECDELIFTETMRERKMKLENSSDAFIIVPGGIGTFDEFFEILTLKQLNQHQKAIVVININGYYDKMKDFLQNAIDNGFLNPECLDLFIYVDTADEALDYIEGYVGKEVDIIKIKNY